MYSKRLESQMASPRQSFSLDMVLAGPGTNSIGTKTAKFAGVREEVLCHTERSDKRHRAERHKRQVYDKVKSL